MESNTTCEGCCPSCPSSNSYHHVMSQAAITSEFLTKLMFGFSSGDRSAKAKLVAISGASSAKLDQEYLRSGASLKVACWTDYILVVRTTQTCSTLGDPLKDLSLRSMRIGQKFQTLPSLVCIPSPRKQKPFRTDHQPNPTSLPKKVQLSL